MATQVLAKWTLGNIGESSRECRLKNYKEADQDWTIRCPDGQEIKALDNFGLQKLNAQPEDNVCPQNVQDISTSTSLDFDQKCNLRTLSELD
jgi:hypothetical protein